MGETKLTDQLCQNGLENIFESYLTEIKERSNEINEISENDKEKLTLQAKMFYFCKETGNIFSLQDYEEWKSNQPNQLNYEKIVELIVQGKENEIPGIKQIPNTILEGESSKSTIDKRQKPWEVKDINDTSEVN